MALNNVVTGGDDAEQRRYGDWLEDDQRYDHGEELVSILPGAWSGFRLGWQAIHCLRRDNPPSDVLATLVVLGGASDAAAHVPARRVYVHPTFGVNPGCGHRAAG